MEPVNPSLQNLSKSYHLNYINDTFMCDDESKNAINILFRKLADGVATQEYLDEVYGEFEKVIQNAVYRHCRKKKTFRSVKGLSHTPKA